MAADGYLNFDTKINEKGFEKDLDEFKVLIKSLTSEVKKLSDMISGATDIKFHADTSEVESAASEIASSVDDIPEPEVRVEADTAAAQQAVEAISFDFDMLDSRDVSVDIATETSDIDESAEKIENDLDRIDKTADRAADNMSDSFEDAGQSMRKSIDNSGNSVINTLDRLKSQFKSLAAAVGIAFGIKEIISFGKSAVESAASVNAANSQLEQTFGSLTGSAEDAMKRVADASGIVDTRLKGVGTSIYAFAKTSGMDSVQALDMMEDALQVAADSAAYYDRSLEDTSETLKSFLKGNYANDAALGISCTETTRNAAANKLYGKSFQELSEAQKQLTLLQMVKDANDLAGATGQAARESEGWENVIGNLKETWSQLLAVVGQPVLRIATSVVQQLTSALAVLTQKAQTAVAALSQLFGWEIDNTAAAADNIAESVVSQNALTDAVEETAKAQENSVAGFDKINKLSDNSAGSASGTDSSGGVPATITPVVDDTAIEKNLDDLCGKLERLISPIKLAWDANSPQLIASAQSALGNIKGMVSAVADSFAEVWTDGSGELFFSNIFGIVTDINNTAAGLSARFTEAWTSGDVGVRIFSALFGIVNSILGTIGRMTSATAQWARNIDFTPLLESVAGLLEELEPLTDNIGDGLAWFYENVLLPLGDWTIKKYVPTYLNYLTSAIKLVNSVITVLKPLAQFLIDKFLKPIASWTGGVIIAAMNGISNALSGLADWITQHQSLCEDIIIVIGSVAAAIGIVLGAQAIGGLIAAMPTILANIVAQTAALVANAAAWIAVNAPIIAIVAAIAAVIAIGALLIKHWDEVKDFMIGVWESIKKSFSNVGKWFKEKFTQAWSNIKNAWSSVKQWFSDLWENIKKIFAAVGTWFKDRFTEAWDSITVIFSAIGSWFSSRWDDIKAVFSAVGSWFGNIFQTAWDNIKAVFEKPGEFFGNVWEAIKSCFSHVTSWFSETFSKAWQAVKDVFSKGGEVFTGITDGIADTFKTVVNGLIDGINWIISQPFNAINSALNGIKSISIAGAKPFSWLPTISIPEIPKLAQGTVVPANYGNFLAMLGDNKRETEVVSPLSTMKKALADALRENGGTGPKEVVIYTYLYPNSSAFHREVVKIVNEDNARKGR